jgi:phospholipid transport system substrate-binding protein
MNHKRFRISLSVGLVLLLSLFATQAQAVAADQFVKTHAERVLARIMANQSSLKANPEKLYQLIRSDILPHIDFHSMSQSVLGKHWKSASATQRKAFIDAFSQLLIRTYGTALLNYSGQAIDYKPEQPSKDGKYAVVRTRVPNSGGSPVAIDYRLRSQGASWKVVDIKVGGVSLVSNYRTSFSAQVGKDGLDGLIQQLQKKTR